MGSVGGPGGVASGGLEDGRPGSSSTPGSPLKLPMLRPGPASPFWLMKSPMSPAPGKPKKGILGWLSRGSQGFDDRGRNGDARVIDAVKELDGEPLPCPIEPPTYDCPVPCPKPDPPGAEDRVAIPPRRPAAPRRRSLSAVNWGDRTSPSGSSRPARHSSPHEQSDQPLAPYEVLVEGRSEGEEVPKLLDHSIVCLERGDEAVDQGDEAVDQSESQEGMEGPSHRQTGLLGEVALASATDSLRLTEANGPETSTVEETKGIDLAAGQRGDESPDLEDGRLPPKWRQGKTRGFNSPVYDMTTDSEESDGASTLSSAQNGGSAASLVLSSSDSLEFAKVYKLPGTPRLRNVDTFTERAAGRILMPVAISRGDRSPAFANVAESSEVPDAGTLRGRKGNP